MNDTAASSGLTQIYAQRILWREWPERHRFTLDDLIAESGKSRTVVREVMRELEGLGLIRAKRRTGLEVLPAERWNVFDPRIVRWQLSGPRGREQYRILMEMRTAVEPLAGSLAAARATPEQRAELLELVAQMRRDGEAGNLQAFLELDVRFHQGILEASGNPLFRSFGQDVNEVLVSRTNQGRMPQRPKPEALDLHEDAALAISQGDGDGAFRALSALTHEALEGVEETWEESRSVVQRQQ